MYPRDDNGLSFAGGEGWWCAPQSDLPGVP